MEITASSPSLFWGWIFLNSVCTCKSWNDFRNVKRDVYELVKGPTGKDNFYILSALSDMKQIFEAEVKDLKKSSKKRAVHSKEEEVEGDEQLPAWLRDKPQKPELELSRVRKHLKKIEFYLSWSQDFQSVFEDLC